MSFLAYKHKNGKIFYCFSGEESRIPNYNVNDFDILPPNPITIQSTIMIMTDQPTLDCIVTAHELNEKLTRDEAYERETKRYLEYKKNL